jgi:hypothetical protein
MQDRARKSEDQTGQSENPQKQQHPILKALAGLDPPQNFRKQPQIAEADRPGRFFQSEVKDDRQKRKRERP